MKKTQITALKRIIKNAGNRPALAGIFYDDNGRACVCDGITAIRMSDSPGELPTVPGVKLEHIYKYNAPGVELRTPTADELKTIIKESRAKKERIAFFDFGDGGPLVNARYLLNILTILPDAKIYEAATRPDISPLYFESTRGDALLMQFRREAAARV